MQINPAVVNALMTLRSLSPQALSNISTVTLAEFQLWLADTSNSDNAIDFETQLDILKMLGISGETPRGDIVHYWTLYEPFFSPSSTYIPLDIVLKAFGPAQITYIASHEDPTFSSSNRAHFALRFNSFLAVLEINGHPLRRLRFNPADFPELTWVGETTGVLLSPENWQKLQPGALRVTGLTQYLSYSAQLDQWQTRQKTLLQHGVLPGPNPLPNMPPLNVPTPNASSRIHPLHTPETDTPHNRPWAPTPSSSFDQPIPMSTETPPPSTPTPAAFHFPSPPPAPPLSNPDPSGFADSSFADPFSETTPSLHGQTATARPRSHRPSRPTSRPRHSPK